MKPLSPQELRLGNLFMIEKGYRDFSKKIGKIYQIAASGVFVEFKDGEGGETLGVHCKVKELIPIDLTEDWLIRAGFHKTTENAGNLICYKLSITTHCTKIMTIAKWIESPLGEWQVWLDTSDITRIAYIHSLQNLIHSLTGEELTFK